MQKAVEYGRKEDCGDDYEYKAGKEGVTSGKDFAGVGLQRVYRAHAAEYHGGVEEGVHPAYPLDVMIPKHARKERRCHDKKDHGEAAPHAPDEYAHRHNRLAFMFKVGKYF